MTQNASAQSKSHNSTTVMHCKRVSHSNKKKSFHDGYLNLLARSFSLFLFSVYQTIRLGHNQGVGNVAKSVKIQTGSITLATLFS